MIDYETFCKIHDCRDRQGLTVTQTARALGLHPETVSAWLARPRYERRRSPPRGSLIDPFKPHIARLLDAHPYSAQQIFQRLREEGYQGSMTVLRDYIRRIRPPRRPVYLKLHFAPGECAQVDWGAQGNRSDGGVARLRQPSTVQQKLKRQSCSSPSWQSGRGACGGSARNAAHRCTKHIPRIVRYRQDPGRW